jgi:hypothetical protein
VEESAEIETRALAMRVLFPHMAYSLPVGIIFCAFRLIVAGPRMVST